MNESMNIFYFVSVETVEPVPVQEVKEEPKIVPQTRALEVAGKLIIVTNFIAVREYMGTCWEYFII